MKLSSAFRVETAISCTTNCVDGIAISATASDDFGATGLALGATAAGLGGTTTEADGLGKVLCLGVDSGKGFESTRGEEALVEAAAGEVAATGTDGVAGGGAMGGGATGCAAGD